MLARLLRDHLIENGWKVFFMGTWGVHLIKFAPDDYDNAWDVLGLKLKDRYPKQNPAAFSAPNSLLLVDEAQASYKDEILWGEIIKEQLNGIVKRDMRICLVCSYGSPTTGVEPGIFIPAEFTTSQRITITPQQIPGSPQIGLFTPGSNLTTLFPETVKSTDNNNTDKPKTPAKTADVSTTETRQLSDQIKKIIEVGVQQPLETITQKLQTPVPQTPVPDDLSPDNTPRKTGIGLGPPKPEDRPKTDAPKTAKAKFAILRTTAKRKTPALPDANKHAKFLQQKADEITFQKNIGYWDLDDENQYHDNFTLHEEAGGYIFSFTNGHPGAVNAILSYIYEVCFVYYPSWQ